MTELTFTQINARQTFAGDYEVVLVIPASQKQAVERLYNETTNYYKPMVAKIVKKTNKRSVDANSYCWILCDKIAEKINSTKEEVYQKAIKQVGVFKTLLLQNEAVEDFIRLWNKNGLGDYAEVLHESKKNEGCSVVIAHFGSSKYDTKEMARLIDYIVSEAKELGIQTETPEEIERLKGLWK